MSEVQPWNGWKLMKAQMTLRAEGDQEAVLSAVAAGLDGASFKISDRGAEGFTAKYTNKWLLLDLTVQRTTLVVSATAGGSGTVDVAVRVVSGGSHSTGGKKAAQGLTSAVRTLEGNGLRVSTTEWTAIES